MRRTFTDSVQSFLRHQAAGRDRSAERALARAFRALPALAPSSAFAERVVARLGRLPLAAASRDVAGLPWRFLLAVAGALVAIAVLSLPSVLWLVRLGYEPGLLREISIGALLGAIQRFGEGLVVWETLAGICRTVAAAAAAPAPLATLAAVMLLSIAGFRTLRGLVATERSSPYA